MGTNLLNQSVIFGAEEAEINWTDIIDLEQYDGVTDLSNSRVIITSGRMTYYVSEIRDDEYTQEDFLGFRNYFGGWGSNSTRDRLFNLLTPFTFTNGNSYTIIANFHLRNSGSQNQWLFGEPPGSSISFLINKNSGAVNFAGQAIAGSVGTSYQDADISICLRINGSSYDFLDNFRDVNGSMSFNTFDFDVLGTMSASQNNSITYETLYYIDEYISDIDDCLPFMTNL